MAEHPKPGRRPASRLQIVGLLIFAPICAEYLAAYDDSTGHPGRLLAGLLILGPLYGAAALIIRETARRAHLGWSGMFLLATAFGLLQAGVIDQSLFSESYRGIEEWDRSRSPTLLAPVGFSVRMAANFIGGHVIYSFCAPIALIEAVRPERRHEPWLGTGGLAVIAVLYAAAAAFILADHLSRESSHASALQVAASLLVAAGLVAGAFVLGRRQRTTWDRPAIRPSAVFLLSLIAATAFNAAPESWAGASVAVAALALGAAGIAYASHAPDWDLRHGVAVAAGALLSRGLLAFTYEPLLGAPSAVSKYLHNAVLLAVVIALWAVAARRAYDQARAHP